MHSAVYDIDGQTIGLHNAPYVCFSLRNDVCSPQLSSMQTSRQNAATDAHLHAHTLATPYVHSLVLTIVQTHCARQYTRMYKYLGLGFYACIVCRYKLSGYCKMMSSMFYETCHERNTSCPVKYLVLSPYSIFVFQITVG